MVSEKGRDHLEGVRTEKRPNAHLALPSTVVRSATNSRVLWHPERQRGRPPPKQQESLSWHASRPICRCWMCQVALHQGGACAFGHKGHTTACKNHEGVVCAGPVRADACRSAHMHCERKTTETLRAGKLCNITWPTQRQIPHPSKSNDRPREAEETLMQKPASTTGQWSCTTGQVAPAQHTCTQVLVHNNKSARHSSDLPSSSGEISADKIRGHLVGATAVADAPQTA